MALYLFGYSVFCEQFCRRESGKGCDMETRIALIGIIVEKDESAEPLNHLLHEYRNLIVGRMGIPYRSRGVNIISVAVDAPQDQINALSGKIGRLDGVSAKTVYANVTADHNGN